MSKTQFTSSRLRDLLFVVPPMKLVNSKDEALLGGFLLPFKIVQCSQTCSHRFLLFVPSLTYILNTSPLPHHKHQNSVVPAFSKTGSCSLKLVSQNPSLGNPQRLLPKSRNGIGAILLEKPSPGSFLCLFIISYPDLTLSLEM